MSNNFTPTEALNIRVNVSTKMLTKGWLKRYISGDAGFRYKWICPSTGEEFKGEWNMSVAPIEAVNRFLEEK